MKREKVTTHGSETYLASYPTEPIIMVSSMYATVAFIPSPPNRLMIITLQYKATRDSNRRHLTFGRGRQRNVDSYIIWRHDLRPIHRGQRHIYSPDCRHLPPTIRVCVTLFLHASRNLYCDYFSRQSGGVMPVFSGARIQRGHGLGSILGGFFCRLVLPFVKNNAKNVLTNAVKTRWRTTFWKGDR